MEASLSAYRKTYHVLLMSIGSALRTIPLRWAKNKARNIWALMGDGMGIKSTGHMGVYGCIYV